MTKWIVVDSTQFYPSIFQFEEYKEAYAKYIELCDFYKWFKPSQPSEVILAEIDRRRKYGRK